MNEQTVLFDLLKEGVSPAHVVKSCEKRLEDAGFEKIAYEKEWNLKAGGRYYVDHHDTTTCSAHCSGTYGFSVSAH